MNNEEKNREETLENLASMAGLTDVGQAAFGLAVVIVIVTAIVAAVAAPISFIFSRVPASLLIGLALWALAIGALVALTWQ